jgi:hypothetical protein
VAVAVLFALVHANTRYFYCEALGLSATDPCAQAAGPHSRASADAAPGAPSDSCPTGALDRKPSDCCQVITMPSVPEGARSVEPTVPAAGVIALLPAVQLTWAAAWSEGARSAPERERWQVPPPSASERRAQLMVFLA